MNEQMNIDFAVKKDAPLVVRRFAGAGYLTMKDHERLNDQIGRIFKLMKDKKHRTLREIEEATGDPQASISAQLRFLTRPEFGGHTKDKRRRGGEGSGTWEYQIIPNPYTYDIFGSNEALRKGA